MLAFKVIYIQLYTIRIDRTTGKNRSIYTETDRKLNFNFEVVGIKIIAKMFCPYC